MFYVAHTLSSTLLAKINSSPSSGAGVIAQYALHVWDSQEEPHSNRSREKPQAHLHLKTSR